MGKYSNQASMYAANTANLNQSLNEISKTIDSINMLLSTQDDEILRSIVSKGETIKSNIKNIVSKRNSITSSLKEKAIYLDQQLEERLRESNSQDSNETGDLDE